MNSKLILPAIFTSVFTSLGAQAELTPDAAAFRACLDRFEAVSRDQDLNARPAAAYRAATEAAGTYHYYFNASGPAAEAEQRHYRVECKARRVGKVTEFAIDPGLWVYEKPVDSRIASR
jgi:hypothetical protein